MFPGYIRAFDLFDDEEFEIVRGIFHDQPRPDHDADLLNITRVGGSDLPILGESEMACASEAVITPGGIEAYCLKKKFGIDWGGWPSSAIPHDQLDWMLDFRRKLGLLIQEIIASRHQFVA